MGMCHDDHVCLIGLCKWDKGVGCGMTETGYATYVVRVVRGSSWHSQVATSIVALTCAGLDYMRGMGRHPTV